MELNKDIPHHFDISKMKTGDWFLGCSYCWFQLEPNAAAKPTCPNCNKPMSILYVRA